MTEQKDLFTPPLILAATGHRPNKLPGKEAIVKEAYRKAFLELKPTWFISGMALGVDTWSAEVALELNIPLWAAVPFEGQDRLWPQPDRDRFNYILSKASRVSVVCSGDYNPDMFQKRNKFMVDNCHILLAYWDGTPGGTGNCVKYAQKINKNMLNLLKKSKTEDINNFTGTYSFLSNFYNAPVVYDGVNYKTSEHAYQTQKTPIESERKAIMQAKTAADSRKLGRSCQMRKDWENVKYSIMYHIVRAKFEQNKDIQQKLLDTGEAKLVESNYWHDTFFGCCTCSKHKGEGKNNLGKILMQVRKEIAENNVAPTDK